MGLPNPGQVLFFSGFAITIVGFGFLVGFPKQEWKWWMWFLLIIGLIFLGSGAWLWTVNSAFNGSTPNRGFDYNVGGGLIASSYPNQPQVIFR